MALSNAEIQRRYRERRDNDPVRRQQNRTKDVNRYHTAKDAGKIKSINQMSDRERRVQRRRWRKTQKQKRKRIKDAASQLNLTPPMSPVSPEYVNVDTSERHKRKKSHNKSQRNKMKRLTKELESAKRSNARYRKRLERMQNDKNTDSPRTKTKKLLRISTESSIRKKLLFHHVLLEQMRIKYNQPKPNGASSYSVE